MLRGEIMESTSLGIPLAIVLSLMCALPGSGYVGRNGLTDTSVPIEAQSENAGLEQNFKIKYGQEVMVKGQNLKVKFDSLLDDSRCPTDVECVWPGDAEIVISVKRANAHASNMELHTNEQFTQAAKYQRYMIKLVALDPYPRTRVKKKPSDYVATLLIKKE